MSLYIDLGNDYTKLEKELIEKNRLLNERLEAQTLINETLIKQLSICGVMQSLLCVDSKSHNFITIGKKYEILQKLGDNCIIVNDLGIQQVYSIECFESEKK